METIGSCPTVKTFFLILLITISKYEWFYLIADIFQVVFVYPPTVSTIVVIAFLGGILAAYLDTLFVTDHADNGAV